MPRSLRQMVIDDLLDLVLAPVEEHEHVPTQRVVAKRVVDLVGQDLERLPPWRLTRVLHSIESRLTIRSRRIRVHIEWAGVQGVR
jgi:hypothetical protein